MKYFKDDTKRRISGDNPKQITFRRAVKELSKLPSAEQSMALTPHPRFGVRTAFIGFENSLGELLHFQKNGENNWWFELRSSANKEKILFEGNHLTSPEVYATLYKFFLRDKENDQETEGTGLKNRACEIF